MKPYILLMICLSGSLMSCSKMLDLQDDGRTTMEDVFSRRDGVMGYLNSCYGYCPAPYMDRSSYCDEAQDSDDIMGDTKFAGWYADIVTAQNFGNYSPDGSPWARLYEGIRKCNVFIENIQNVNPVNIVATESEVQGWVAQAYTLRALYYLQLIKRYGAVPILLTPYEMTHDYSADRRASFSEVVKLIVHDCDMALSAPDTQDGFSWAISDNEYGIITRAVPYAIKSQAVTYAASPYWTDGTFTWSDATDVNKEALYQLLSNDYKLFDLLPDAVIAQNPYAYYFISSSNDKRAIDKETIYQVGNQMEVWKYAGLPTTVGMVKAGPCPTQEMVDSYEMVETGLAPISDYSDEQHLTPIINNSSGYNPNNPYVGRDPRFYASIYFNGAVRTLGTVVGRNDDYSKDIASTQMMTIEEKNDDGEYYKITTSGNDPYFFMTAFPDLGIDWDAATSITLSFDYNSTTDLVGAELYFEPGLDWFKRYPNDTSLTLPSTNGQWQTVEVNLFDHLLANYGPNSGSEWGKDGCQIRFDPHGDQMSYAEFKLRNINVNIKVTAAPSTADIYEGGNDGISNTDRRYTRTGYYMRKFNNWRSNVANNSDGAIRLFRLAEIYLNFAESAYQSHGPEEVIELGPGMSMSARDAVNKVRERAGMPHFPTGMSIDDFGKKYRNERRVELAFEEHRYFDVRRWNILSDTDKYVSGMKINKIGDDYTYTRFSIKRNSWSNKYLLYPLEQEEVNKMEEFTGVNWQNPGW